MVKLSDVKGAQDLLWLRRELEKRGAGQKAKAVGKALGLKGGR